MEENDTQVMELAHAIMDLFPGLDLTDAISSVKRNQWLVKTTKESSMVKTPN